MWTLDGEALENGSPNRLIEYVVQKASPGAIILLHNGRMTTIEGLPKIIEGLRKRGFGFVTIDQIAYKPATSMRAAHRSPNG
jgi:peptidoglycan/xylan/chitin deacetylase (PgdA/CDA1 family)